MNEKELAEKFREKIRSANEILYELNKIGISMEIGICENNQILEWKKYEIKVIDNTYLLCYTV